MNVKEKIIIICQSLTDNQQVRAIKQIINQAVLLQAKLWTT